MKFKSYIFLCQLLSNIIISKSYFITFKEREPSKINKTRRSMISQFDSRWTDGVIPYEFKNVFNGFQLRIIKRAIREWENSTCIKFVPRIPEKHSNYIEVNKEECGCCANIGNQNFGKHTVSFSDKCLTIRSSLHELGHVIGLYHEHQRPDRDNYIKVKIDVVPEESLQDVIKYEGHEARLFGTYDYDSIMHYPLNSGDKILIEIIKINGINPQIGTGSSLSKNDIAGINYFYECPRCGNTYFSNNGILTFPNNSFTNPEYCKWTIRAAAGERIKLNIKYLDILQSNDCSDEFLEVKNGYQKDNSALARYCGKVDAATIIASNWLTVTFFGNQSGDNTLKFSMEYQTLCGNDVYIESNETYYLESPNYPEDYQPYKQCEWYIRAPYKHYLLIKFDYFELEESEMCKNDFLEAREGRNENSPLIGTYCGKAENLKIVSPMGRMYLMFFSDGSTQAGGFSAAISAVPI